MTQPAAFEVVENALASLGPHWFDDASAPACRLPSGVTVLATDRRETAGAVLAQVVTRDAVELVVVDLARDPKEGWWSAGGGSASGSARHDGPATRPPARQSGEPGGPDRAWEVLLDSGGQDHRTAVLRLRSDVVALRVDDREVAVPDHGTVVVLEPHGVTSTLALTAADGRRWSDELRRPPWTVVEDHDEGSGRWYMGWGDPDDRS